MTKKAVKKGKAKEPTKPVKKEKRTDVGFGKPPKEHQFKPGQSGNPSGRPPMSEEKRALIQLTEKALIECIEKVFTGTEAEALEAIESPNVTLGHKLILRAAIDAAHNGNYDKFNTILERVLGKVPAKLDMTTKGMALNISQGDKEIVKQAMKDVEEEV